MKYCPECNIGLNNVEVNYGFCKNCHANFDGRILEDDNDEYDMGEPHPFDEDDYDKPELNSEL